jgi:hypothetical protein
VVLNAASPVAEHPESYELVSRVLALYKTTAKTETSAATEKGEIAMKKIFAMIGLALPLLLASGAGAASIGWVQQNYNTGSVGYLPRMTSDGWDASTDIFQTSTGFNYLAYQTASVLFNEGTEVWAPYAFYEIDSSGNYIIGHAPSIAVFTNVNNAVMTALEVHQGGQDNGSELWYTLGSCNPGLQLPPCGGVDWLTGQSYDEGYNPSVAIDISIKFPAVSPVVEIHQVGSSLSDLRYRVGTLTSATLNSKGTLIIPPSITWGPSYPIDNPDGASVAGYAPSVSVANGYVVVAYQGTGGTLSYSFGQISGNVIGWQNPVNYDTGYSPSISMLGSDFAGGSAIVEVHQGETGTGPLHYRLGKLNSSTTPTGITWTPNSSTKYATSGCSPSVALQEFYGSLLVEELHSTACGGAFPLLSSLGTF